jgi:hypothetical protein
MRLQDLGGLHLSQDGTILQLDQGERKRDKEEDRYFQVQKKCGVSTSLLTTTDEEACGK